MAAYWCGRVEGLTAHATSHLTSSFAIIEFLKNLNFPLFEGFLFILVLVLKLLYRNDLASAIMLRLVHMAEASFAYDLKKPVLIPQDIDRLLLGDIVS